MLSYQASYLSFYRPSSQAPLKYPACFGESLFGLGELYVQLLYFPVERSQPCSLAGRVLCLVVPFEISLRRLGQRQMLIGFDLDRWRSLIEIVGHENFVTFPPGR